MYVAFGDRLGSQNLRPRGADQHGLAAEQPALHVPAHQPYLPVKSLRTATITLCGVAAQSFSLSQVINLSYLRDGALPLSLRAHVGGPGRLRDSCTFVRLVCAVVAMPGCITYSRRLCVQPWTKQWPSLIGTSTLLWLEGSEVVSQVMHRRESSAGSDSGDSPCSSDGLCCPDSPVESAEETAWDAYDSVSDGDELTEHDEDSIHIDWVSHAVTPLLRCSEDGRKGLFLVPCKSQQGTVRRQRFSLVALRQVLFADGPVWVSWCTNPLCGPLRADLGDVFDHLRAKTTLAARATQCSAVSHYGAIAANNCWRLIRAEISCYSCSRRLHHVSVLKALTTRGVTSHTTCTKGAHTTSYPPASGCATQQSCLCTAASCCAPTAQPTSGPSCNTASLASGSLLKTAAWLLMNTPSSCMGS